MNPNNANTSQSDQFVDDTLAKAQKSLKNTNKTLKNIEKTMKKH